MSHTHRFVVWFRCFVSISYTLRIVIVRACERPFRHVTKHGYFTLRIVTERACERPDQ